MMSRDMADRGEVLVVHGIANRERALFETQSAAMVSALAPREVQLVFWGDLGPIDDLASIPAPGVGDAIGGDTTWRPETEASRTKEVVQVACQRLAAETQTAVPEATVATVEELAAELVALHPDLSAAAIAETLAEGVLLTGPVGSASLDPDGTRETDGEPILGRVHRGLRRVVASIDRGLDEASNRAAGSLLRSERRTGIGRVVARTVGDILTYERDGNQIRGRLDAAYRAARARSERVSIVAHSLGALVSVEWLLGAPVDAPDGTAPEDRQVDVLVTFGCQVPLFCELQGLMGADGMLAKTSGASDVLDLRVRRWCNVWHVLDPLAFVASPVVTLAGGLQVEDLRLDLEGPPTSLDFHSSYWNDARFLRWLATAV